MTAQRIDEGWTSSRVGELVDELDDEIELKFNALRADDPPEVLYHYTTTSGLRGILESGSLFMTDAFFLNDQTEVVYGRDLAREVLAGFRSDKAEVQTFLQHTVQRFDPLGPEGDGYRPFVACFCSNGSLLSQWRGYAASATGYALGLESAVLSNRAERLGYEAIGVVLEQVEYDRRNQESIVRHAVDRVLGNFEQDLEIVAAADIGNLRVLYFNVLSTVLADLFPRFKHPMFAEEREWRLLIRRLSDTETALVRFREGSRYVIPYFPLDLRFKTGPQQGHLPLREIVHAPIAEPDLVKRSLRMFLRAHGYADNEVIIKGSEIPLRQSL